MELAANFISLIVCRLLGEGMLAVKGRPDALPLEEPINSILVPCESFVSSFRKGYVI